jgi:LCP family protein required for cell wall assembly
VTNAAEPKTATQRRWPRRVIASLLGVFLLFLSGLGYLYWRYSSIPRIAGVGSDQLDPRNAARPGGTVVTLPTPSGVAITTVAPSTTVPVAAGDTEVSPIPPPGVPGTVPGLPGPGPDDIPASTEPAAPLPGLDVEGLDATDTSADTIPAPLVTIPESQVVNRPLLDTSTVQAVGGKNSFNILMTGTDNREDVPDNQAVGLGKGKVSGSRSDTIMVLRVDPDARKAWVLSIPRDLYVRMPGTNTFDRINAASARSDALLVRTIQENLGIPIRHMMKVDFVGFQRVVAAVGGVNICFPKPARDKVTALNQPVAGCFNLNPRQATAYVRSRKYEEKQKDGTWKRDPSSDLGRIARQQTFIRNGMTAAIKRGMRNPKTLNSVLAEMQTAIAFDKSLGFTEVLSLANKMRSFEPDSLETLVVPTVGQVIDKKAVLVLDLDKAVDTIGIFGHRSARS